MQAPSYGASNNSPPNYAHREENAPLIPKDNSDKFTPSVRYNDVWATILFVANAAAFTGLNVYSFKSYNQNLAHPFRVLEDGTEVATNAFIVDHALSVLALSSIAVSFGLSFGYFVLMQRQAAFLVKFSFFFSVAITFVLGIFQILSGHWFWGGMFLLSSILVLLCYKLWAARMPFSILILETVTSVTRKYPGTLAVSG